MKTIFDKLFVTKAEYSIIKTMDTSERLRWLFDTYDATTMQIKGLDLSAFFTEVRDNLEQYNRSIDTVNHELNIINSEPDHEDVDFVDVMIDDENIMIESNSLRAVRHVIYKFMESGYILRRDIVLEKMFRKDKSTRYIRVFKIINYSSEMCLN